MSILARALIQSGQIPDSDAVERCVQRARQRQTSLPAELVAATLIDSQTLMRFIEDSFGFLCVEQATLQDSALLPPAISRLPRATSPSAYPVNDYDWRWRTRPMMP